MDLRDNGAGGKQDLRDTYRGFGDGLTLAFEIALVPPIVGAIGYGLDRLTGTLPVFTIVFVLLAVVGLATRMWFNYDAQMKVHEARGPWARAHRGDE